MQWNMHAADCVRPICAAFARGVNGASGEREQDYGVVIVVLRTGKSPLSIGLALTLTFWRWCSELHVGLGIYFAEANGLRSVLFIDCRDLRSELLTALWQCT